MLLTDYLLSCFSKMSQKDMLKVTHKGTGKGQPHYLKNETV